MSICRFVAREAGIAGRNSLEAAMVDEIVDVIQDAIEANVRTQENNIDRSFIKPCFSTKPGILQTDGRSWSSSRDRHSQQLWFGTNKSSNVR